MLHNSIFYIKNIIKLKNFKYKQNIYMTVEDVWYIEYILFHLLKETYNLSDINVNSIEDFKKLHKNNLIDDIKVFLDNKDLLHKLREYLTVACKQQLSSKVPLEFFVDVATLCFFRTMLQFQTNIDFIDVDLSEDILKFKQSKNINSLDENIDDLNKDILDFKLNENFCFINSTIFCQSFIKNSTVLSLLSYCFGVKLDLIKIQRIFHITISLLWKNKIIKRITQVVRVKSVLKTIINYELPWNINYCSLIIGYTPIPSVTIALGDDLLRYGWSSVSVIYLLTKNNRSQEQSNINSSAIHAMDSIYHYIDYELLELCDNLYSKLLKNKLLIAESSAIELKEKIKQIGEVYKDVLKIFKKLSKSLNIDNSILNILTKLEKILIKGKLKSKLNIKLSEIEYNKLINFWINALALNLKNNEYYKTTLNYLENKNTKDRIINNNFTINNKNNYPKLKLKNFPGSEELLESYAKLKKVKSDLFELQNNYLEILAKIRTLQQHETVINILKEKKINEYCLQHHVDFRGRAYSNSILSVINTKWMRSIIYYGYFTEEELMKLDEEVIATNAYNNLSKCFYLIKNLNLINQRPLILQGIMWCLIDLAKHYKNEITKDCKISLEDFIKKGLEIFKKAKNITYIDENLDFDQNLEINKVCIIINELIAGNITKKYYLNKDTTASVLQHLLKILGIRDEKALELCNLAGNNVWTDPYMVILDNFFKNNTINEVSKLFFNRNNLKRVMMTYYYSVTYYTALKYFLKSCRSQGPYKLVISEAIEKSLIEDFLKFFNYLKNNHEIDLFFEIKSSKLKKNPKNITLLDDSNIILIYYTKYNKRVEVKHKNGDIRTTFTTYYLKNNQIDWIKTGAAFIPNLIHAFDANYARRILSCYPNLVVHDSFAPCIQQICQVVDKLNEVYKYDVIVNKLFKTKNDELINEKYNMFIIL